MSTYDDSLEDNNLPNRDYSIQCSSNGITLIEMYDDANNYKFIFDDIYAREKNELRIGFKNIKGEEIDNVFTTWGCARQLPRKIKNGELLTSIKKTLFTSKNGCAYSMCLKRNNDEDYVSPDVVIVIIYIENESDIKASFIIDDKGVNVYKNKCACDSINVNKLNNTKNGIKKYSTTFKSNVGGDGKGYQEMHNTKEKQIQDRKIEEEKCQVDDKSVHMAFTTNNNYTSEGRKCYKNKSKEDPENMIRGSCGKMKHILLHGVRNSVGLVTDELNGRINQKLGCGGTKERFDVNNNIKTKDIGTIKDDIKAKDIGTIKDDIKTKDIGTIKDDIKAKDVGIINDDIKTKDIGTINDDIKAKDVGTIKDDIKAKDVGTINDDIKTKDVGTIKDDIKTKDVGIINDDKGDKNGKEQNGYIVLDDEGQLQQVSTLGKFKNKIVYDGSNVFIVDDVDSISMVQLRYIRDSLQIYFETGDGELINEPIFKSSSAMNVESGCFIINIKKTFLKSKGSESFCLRRINKGGTRKCKIKISQNGTNDFLYVLNHEGGDDFFY